MWISDSLNDEERLWLPQQNQMALSLLLEDKQELHFVKKRL